MTETSTTIEPIVGAEPSLDELMRRAPRALTRADRVALVTVLRQKRVVWEAKEDAAKAKRDGEAPAEETDNGE